MQIFFWYVGITFLFAGIFGLAFIFAGIWDVPLSRFTINYLFCNLSEHSTVMTKMKKWRTVNVMEFLKYMFRINKLLLCIRSIRVSRQYYLFFFRHLSCSFSMARCNLFSLYGINSNEKSLVIL